MYTQFGSTGYVPNRFSTHICCSFIYIKQFHFTRCSFSKEWNTKLMKWRLIKKQSRENFDLRHEEIWEREENTTPDWLWSVRDEKLSEDIWNNMTQFLLGQLQIARKLLKFSFSVQSHPRSNFFPDESILWWFVEVSNRPWKRPFTRKSSISQVLINFQ